MKKLSLILGGYLLSWLCLAPMSYADANNNPTQAPSHNTIFTQCHEPRPTICYEAFSPVCAVRESPVNEHCDSPACQLKQVTYANDCKACADSSISGYSPGRCH
jgi:hypothetical protein